MNQKGFTPHYLRDNKKTGEKRTKNSAGFIPIVLIIIAVVVVAAAVFCIVKYRDEITANVSQMFKGADKEPVSEGIMENITGMRK